MTNEEANVLIPGPTKDLNKQLFTYISQKEKLEALLVLGANPDYIETNFNVPIKSI